jgi:hypothetical protein
VQPIEEVGPRLHHHASICQSLCLVVRTSDLVALGMRELELDEIWMPALFVEIGRRR